MTKMTNKFEIYQNFRIRVDFCTTFLSICRKTLFLAWNLQVCNLFAVNDLLLFYLLELHIFPSPNDSESAISSYFSYLPSVCQVPLPGHNYWWASWASRPPLKSLGENFGRKGEMRKKGKKRKREGRKKRRKGEREARKGKCMKMSRGPFWGPFCLPWTVFRKRVSDHSFCM